MNRELIIALIISLAATLILEAAFYLIIGKRNKRDLLLAVLVNIITNPVVVLVYWLGVLYSNFDTVMLKALLEIFAVLTEGYYYRKYAQGIKRPFAFSVAANGFSFGVGVILQNVGLFF